MAKSKLGWWRVETGVYSDIIYVVSAAAAAEAYATKYATRHAPRLSPADYRVLVTEWSGPDPEHYGAVGDTQVFQVSTEIRLHVEVKPVG